MPGAVAHARSCLGVGVPAPSDFTYLTNLATHRTITDNVSGTGTAVTDSGSSGVLAYDGAGIGTAQIGQYITIAGCPTAANNGTFPITARSSTTVTYTNAAAVTEAAPSATFATAGIFNAIANIQGAALDFGQSSAGFGIRVDPVTFVATGKSIGWKTDTGTYAARGDFGVNGLDAFNGVAISTVGFYARSDNAASVNTWLSMSTATANDTNAMVVRNTTGPGGWNAIAAVAGNVNAIVTHAIDTSAFHLYCWVRHGTAVNELWVDGVLIGNAVAASSPQPTNLRYAKLFNNLGAGAGARMVGHFACPRRMTAGEMLATRAYYQASLA